MTMFDERERSFEKKFSIDQELKFNIEARRNKLLGHWAAAKLGLSGGAADDYIKEILRVDLLLKGDAVFNKLSNDFKGRGVDVSDSELRTTMTELMRTAAQQMNDAMR